MTLKELQTHFQALSDEQIDKLSAAFSLIHQVYNGDAAKLPECNVYWFMTMIATERDYRK
jgi:hypothetical protein